MSRRHRYTDDTSQSFVSRWSQRKRRARASDGQLAGEEADSNSPETGVEARYYESNRAEKSADGRPVGASEPQDAEPVKTDEDMPDLDSIDENTNMSDFFSPGVSEQLRTQALRRLWRLSKFNVLDGLDDYNEDFRNFEALGDIVTADMRHRMEVEQQRRDELADAEEESTRVDVVAEGEERGQSGDGDQQDDQTVSASIDSDVEDVEDGDEQESETSPKGLPKRET